VSKLESAIWTLNATKEICAIKVKSFKLLFKNLWVMLFGIITKFLLNPYFIFRIIILGLSAVIGIDLFTDKISFTTFPEGDDGKDSNEMKIDKGKEIAKDSGIESTTESETNVESSNVREVQDNNNETEATDPTLYKNLSFAEKMEALALSLMAHDDEVLNLQQEEEAKGTKDIITRAEMVEVVVDNRINDTKNILELTKALNKTNLDVEDVSTDKRTLDEESLSDNEENSSESKKFKSTEKDSNLNKRSRDNGEGPSETN